MVAYHEAGHAVIGLKLKNAQKVQKIALFHFFRHILISKLLFK
ncbi:hypothetical protein ACMBCQ_02420, partial [Candidatus Phytoplasma citri]